MIIDQAIAGEELKGGDLVYIAGDGKYYKAIKKNSDSHLKEFTESLEHLSAMFSNAVRPVGDQINAIWESMDPGLKERMLKKQRNHERYVRRYRNIGRRRNGKG
jgi:hypothetical protein